MEEKPQFRRKRLFEQPLSRVVEQMVKPVFKKHGFAEHRILTQWTVIVGKELADCSLPQKLSFAPGKKEGGTLHLLVAAGRGLEFQQMQPVILDRINTYFGYRAVARVAMMQTAMPLLQKSSRPAVTVSPPASAMPAAMTQSVEACNDAPLREALASLGAALVAARK